MARATEDGTSLGAGWQRKSGRRGDMEGQAGSVVEPWEPGAVRLAAWSSVLSWGLVLNTFWLSSA